MQKICYVTGSRADYGPMTSVLRALQQDERFELVILVTGMHLQPEHGNTIQVIRDDGFTIGAEVAMMLSGDSGATMAKSLGVGIVGITQALQSLGPDAVLLQGDRGEALAGAIAAAHLNIRVIHMGGGDVSGSIDDRIRHAITQFSDLHLPGTEEAADRIRVMTCRTENVLVVGDPAVDLIAESSFAPPAEVADRFGIDLARPSLLVVQHPVTDEIVDSARQAIETMEAVIELGYQAVVLTPNADAGGWAMREALFNYRDVPHIQIHDHIPRGDYLGLLNVASVMVGNSSSGLIEAPTFGCPVVNIGNRQKNRVRGANVFDVGYCRNEITRKVRELVQNTALRSSLKHCRNPYGSGDTANRTVSSIANFLGRRGDHHV